MNYESLSLPLDIIYICIYNITKIKQTERTNRRSSEMEITREINQTGKTGKNIRLVITKEKKVSDKISYSDGWNVNLGPQTLDFTDIKIFVDGQLFDTSRMAPQRLSPDLFKSDAALVAQGGYAKLGKLVLTKERYDLVISIIAEMDAELNAQPDYAAVKAAEVAKAKVAEAAQDAQDAEYQNQLDNGLCPRCGTYCYGDCTAN